jgi:ubiquitin carboxyl-terminal hydrolase L5
VDDDFSVGQEEQSKTIWFMNQTVDSACATLALLNIVMNAPGLDVGERLQRIKEATKDMSPGWRGHTLGEDRFIRATHNAFGRRIDVLTADKCLEQKAQQRATRPRKVPKKATPKKKTTRRKPDTDSANHYVAFIPADGCLWQLDGLCNQPVKIRKRCSFHVLR